MLEPIGTTNRHEFLIQACAFKHQKSRLSPVYPNDPSLVIYRMKKFFFLCIDDPTNFSSFLVIFDYIFFSV